MKFSFREVLRGSHVAAVTIAVLMCWGIIAGLDALYRALAEPLWYPIKAVLILDLPSTNWELWRRYDLSVAAQFLFDALVYLAAAWLLTLWVYGAGPIASLRQCARRIPRRKSA